MWLKPEPPTDEPSLRLQRNEHISCPPMWRRLGGESRKLNLGFISKDRAQMLNLFKMSSKK